MRRLLPAADKMFLLSYFGFLFFLVLVLNLDLDLILITGDI